LNFPVLVSLSNENFDFSKVQSDGKDIRFVTNHCTLLDFELVRWDPILGVGDFWVTVPKIYPSGTVSFLYMYYGNEKASEWVSYGTPWDNQFVSVQHFDSLPDTVFLDSTVNKNNILVKSQDNSSELGGGKVGSSWRLDNASFGIVDAKSSLNLKEFTCEVWIKCASAPTYSARVVEMDAPWKNGWRIEIYSANKLGAAVALVDSTFGDRYLTFGSIPLNDWSYLAVTFQGGAMSTYLNGELIRTDHNVTEVSYQGSYLTIGASHSFNAFFNGYLDEFRLSNIVRSESWLKAQYLSITDSLIVFKGESIR
jgi:hypothetical protein